MSAGVSPKNDEGQANVPKPAFESRANQGIVSHRFQEVDIVRVNWHAAELGDGCEHPIDAAHPGLLSMSCGSVKQAAAVRG